VTAVEASSSGCWRSPGSHAPKVNQDKLKQRYRQLLNTTSRVVGQAKRFSAEIGEGVNQATSVFKQVALKACGRKSMRWCSSSDK
jgi:hypothetical protein